MKDSEQFRSIDTDTMIGNLLHQTEAVVEVDEASLVQGKQELLAWMAEQAPSSSATVCEEPREDRGAPTAADMRSDRDGERPLTGVMFLTVAEVASVMRVSRMTVYRLVHSGHLPAVRVGRSFRIPEQAVHEYLRESYMGSIKSIDRP